MTMNKLSLVVAVLIAALAGAVVAAVYNEVQRPVIDLSPVELQGDPSQVSNTDPTGDGAASGVDGASALIDQPPSGETTPTTVPGQVTPSTVPAMSTPPVIVPQPTFRPPMISSREDIDDDDDNDDDQDDRDDDNDADDDD